ncbi:MAG: Transcriptional regulator, ArsR family protein [Bacteroidetes bacterium]|nr:MAG: Transcriptional regulator, ArsR family protein [Bacteroidota bacterium]
MNKSPLQKNKDSRFADISEMLKALAHPARIAIIDLLCNCGCERMMVKNIYERLKIEQPVASKHLGILKRSGLLKREMKGTSAYFLLNMENTVTICISHCLKKRHD